jgi:hypothetical protein
MVIPFYMPEDIFPTAFCKFTVFFQPINQINSPVREQHIEHQNSSKEPIPMGESKAIDQVGV